jgi:glyoxalase family protein
MLEKGLIKGLHHVTATVNDAQGDYDFYTKVLGLRLVKETVNFDNEAVYHFYYANRIGEPSTVFTTFPYKDQGVRKGVIGTGQVYATTFSVPLDSLGFWKSHFATIGLKLTESDGFEGKKLVFQDPSGLWLELVATDLDTRKQQWISGDFTVDRAIYGIKSVTLALMGLEETTELMKVLGYDIVDQHNAKIRMAAGNRLPGDEVLLMSAKDLPRGINGIGTVHHVAHRVANLEHLHTVRDYVLNDLKLNITEVKDRKYFKSIYFRIPDGVLFEVATEEPGFLIDEDDAHLGSSLKLPDWQEPNRERIEKSLPGFIR